MKTLFTYSFKKFFIAFVIGAALVASIATLQFLFLYDVAIKPQLYILPSLIGGTGGFLISLWVQRVQKLNQNLDEKSKRLALVIEASNIGVWDWFPQTNQLIFDEGWCKLLGYQFKEIEPVFLSWESRVHPDDIEQCYVDINRHINGETPYYENTHRMKHKDGHWVYILDRGKVIERDALGRPLRFSGTHTDISDLKKAEARLEESNRKLQELSLIDGLTGLKNRRALRAQLDQQWEFLNRNKTPFSLLMLDIDYFKEFNDEYGHVAGDNCLKQVAEVLINNVKRTNDIACRFGGEEFLILFSDITSHQAVQFAQSIKDQIEALDIPHAKSKCSEHITLSIGVTSCDQLSCANVKEPIEQADKALYIAKEKGRNRIEIFTKEPVEPL